MAKLPGNDDFEKLQALCQKTHKDQIIWFMNAFWEDFASEQAEKMWAYKLKCDELDLQNHEKGHELDELNAHRLLEAFNETLTVRAMRDNLRSTGAIRDTRLKMVPVSHILIFKYSVDWHILVNASQGDNRAEIEEAQRMLQEVQSAFQRAEAAAQEAAAALREAAAAEAAAKAREAEAKASEAAAKAREAEALASEQAAKAREIEAAASAEESKVREEEARAAQVELEVALAEVKAQEDAYNNKTQDLTRKSEEGGVVSRNKAKAELAQHLAEDPLPLRRAKITAEAAVKKAERATQAAADARAKAEADARAASEARVAAEADARAASQDRAAAEADARAASQARTEAQRARQASEDAKAAAEAALEEASRRVEEAEAYLTELKSKSGNGKGSLWWIERELKEAKAYLPESRGGYRKK